MIAALWCACMVPAKTESDFGGLGAFGKLGEAENGGRAGGQHSSSWSVAREYWGGRWLGA